MKNFAVREALPADLPAITVLAHSLYELHADGHPLLVPAPDFEAEYLKSLQGDLATGDYVLAVAEGETGLIGYADAYIWVFPYLQESRRGFISSLYVDPIRRGGGVGRALVAYLNQWLSERGIRYVELNVSDSNPQALEFWTKVGYRRYIQRLATELPPQP